MTSVALVNCTKSLFQQLTKISQATYFRNMNLNSTILLSSGHRMPVIGIGTSVITDKESVETTMTTAIDAGYRLIDTAFAYGNQYLIGESLQKFFNAGKVKREEVFIVDKLPNNAMHPEAVEYFFKKSAAALQLDYIDLYLIHSPIATKRTSNDGEIFPFKNGRIDTEHVDLNETWKAMESLVRKGYVRSLGLSNFNSEQIKRIYDKAEIKPSNLQVECHVYLPQHQLHDLCKSLNISMTAYCPLGTPNFPQFAREKMGIDYGEAPKLMDDKNIVQIAERYKKTPAQILLNYLVQRRIVPIPKSVNPDHIKQNMEIFDFSLDDKDMDLINTLENGFRYMKHDFWEGMTEHPEYPFNIPF